MSGGRHSGLARLICSVSCLCFLVAGGLAPLGAFAQATPTAEPVLIPGDPSTLGAPAVPEATASTAEGAAPLAQVLAPYADYGTDAAPGVFPRTIRHALGETTIEQQPVRVIVLDTGELDAMLQLGVRPVGAAEYNDSGLPAYLLEQAQGIEVVGTTAEPDLEKIVALKPDLILSSKLRHEAIYDLLSAIAPTVLVDRPGVTFKQNFVLYAQAVGKEIEAAAVVQKYVERAQALNASLPTPRPTTSIVQLRADAIRSYQRANFLGVILTDLGFTRPDSQNIDDFGLDYGQESIADFANGDFVIVAIVNPGNNTFADEALASPLWQQLPAVQSGNVLEVDSSLWIGGIGYGAAFEIMDALEAQFAS